MNQTELKLLEMVRGFVATYSNKLFKKQHYSRSELTIKLEAVVSAITELLLFLKHK